MEGQMHRHVLITIIPDTTMHDTTHTWQDNPHTGHTPHAAERHGDTLHPTIEARDRRRDCSEIHRLYVTSVFTGWHSLGDRAPELIRVVGMTPVEV